MSEEIRITYESIYDLCRRERERGEIQELPESFLEDVENYLAEKKLAYQTYGEKQDIFSRDAQDKALMHIRNVKKILKQLYECRESKIISLAVNKSRTQSNIIDTSTLLGPEKIFYAKLESLLSQNRIEILGRLVEEYSVIRTAAPVKQAEPEKSEAVESFEEDDPEPEKMIAIRMAEDVPAFVGPELEEYGPFSCGESRSLPAQIASILLKNGQANKCDK